MKAHEKNHRQHWLHPIEEKRHETETHGKDFKNLHSHQDRSLAVNVCQIAGVAGKEQERQNEETTDQRDVWVCTAGRGG